MPERLGQTVFEIVGIPGFREVGVEEPVVQGIHRRVEIGEGGDKEAQGVRIDLSDALEQIETGLAWHLFVADDHTDALVMFAEKGHTPPRGCSRCDRREVLEDGLEILQRLQFVVDVEDAIVRTQFLHEGMREGMALPATDAGS